MSAETDIREVLRSRRRVSVVCTIVLFLAAIVMVAGVVLTLTH